MFNFFILSLAVWRITYFFVEEDGPNFIMKDFRDKLDNSRWSDLSPLTCIYCTSVWVSLLLVLFTRSGFLYGLALSAGAIFINSVHKILEKIGEEN